MEELWDMHEKTSQKLEAWEKSISAMCKASCSSMGKGHHLPLDVLS